MLQRVSQVHCRATALVTLTDNGYRDSGIFNPALGHPIYLVLVGSPFEAAGTLITKRPTIEYVPVEPQDLGMRLWSRLSVTEGAIVQHAN